MAAEFSGFFEAGFGGHLRDVRSELSGPCTVNQPGLRGAQYQGGLQFKNPETLLPARLNSAKSVALGNRPVFEAQRQLTGSNR